MTKGRASVCRPQRRLTSLVLGTKPPAERDGHQSARSRIANRRQKRLSVDAKCVNPLFVHTYAAHCTKRYNNLYNSNSNNMYGDVTVGGQGETHPVALACVVNCLRGMPCISYIATTARTQDEPQDLLCRGVNNVERENYVPLALRIVHFF